MAEGFGSIDPGQMVQAASAMKDQVTQALQQARERLELDRRVRENPWMVLGIAAGAGFVLGGGLWPAVRPLVKTAARTALAPSNLLAIAAALGAMRATTVVDEDEAEPQGYGGGTDDGGDEPTSH